MISAFLATHMTGVTNSFFVLARARGKALGELFNAAGRGEWWAIGLLVLFGGLIVWGIVSKFTGGGGEE